MTDLEIGKNYLVINSFLSLSVVNITNGIRKCIGCDAIFVCKCKVTSVGKTPAVKFDGSMFKEIGNDWDSYCSLLL